MTGELEAIFGCDQRISIKASYPVEKRPFHAAPHPSFAVVFEGAKLIEDAGSNEPADWVLAKLQDYRFGNLFMCGQGNHWYSIILSYNERCMVYLGDSRL